MTQSRTHRIASFLVLASMVASTAAGATSTTTERNRGAEPQPEKAAAADSYTVRFVSSATSKSCVSAEFAESIQICRSQDCEHLTISRDQRAVSFSLPTSAKNTFAVSVSLVQEIDGKLRADTSVELFKTKNFKAGQERRIYPTVLGAGDCTKGYAFSVTKAK